MFAQGLKIRLLTIACALMGACGGGASENGSVPQTLSGTLSSNVGRVRVITLDGTTTATNVTGGSFRIALPASPYVVIFDGHDLRPLANLVAPLPGGGVTAMLPGVAPSTRVAGATVESLIDGDSLALGTITVSVDVTVTAEHNILVDLDTDGDGTSDFDDTDDDGDGTADIDEENGLDPDGDGAANLLDTDDDGDGSLDRDDDDDDGDGIADLEELDSDDDGVLDSLDLDDDNDGIADTAESTDTTPDALIGAWYGVTETELLDAVVDLEETFVFGADGGLTAELRGTEEASGCDIGYDLTGTWQDDADGVSDLLVGWDHVSLTVSGCTDPSDDLPTTDVTAEEGELWDDELEGLWEATDGELVIYASNGALLVYGDMPVDSDTTPDDLVGTWNGETELDLGDGTSVVLDEVFVFGADGTLEGHFQGVDETSGCTLDYVLDGSWEDDADGVADLLVGWSSVTLETSGCADPADDSAPTDRTAEEGDLWDDELEGDWEVTASTLTIVSPAGTFHYTR